MLRRTSHFSSSGLSYLAGLALLLWGPLVAAIRGAWKSLNPAAPS